MSNHVACPFCKGVLVNTAAFAGRIVACPHCEKAFTMPPLNSSSPPPEQYISAAKTTAGTSSPQHTSLLPILLAILALVIIVPVVYFRFFDPDEARRRKNEEWEKLAKSQKTAESFPSALQQARDREPPHHQDDELPPTPPISLRTWQVVKAWRGNGAKQTETFIIASREWRIRWRTSNEPFKGAGIFQIFVNDSDDQLISLAANKQGTGSDESYVRGGPGEFYLMFNTANVDWEVTVEDKR